MRKYLKIALMVFPWAGMIVLIVVHQLALVGWSINEKSWDMQREWLENDNARLVEFVKAREIQSNDKAAFERLGWIESYQFDGKYAPWPHTDLGLVMFDEDGFISKICFMRRSIDTTDCPPNF